jgi:uncharacterized protein (TIGR04255 family)
MTQRYPKPPITEAVFEFRFQAELSERDRARLRDRFKKRYPAIDEQQAVDVKIGPGGVDTSSKLVGYKQTASNGCDMVMFQMANFDSIRLAPYNGWEKFIQTARDNFDEFTKVVGRLQVVRLAARFLNRIDIPLSAVEGRDLALFTKLGIALPQDLSGGVGPYSLAVNFVESKTGVKILLQSGVVSPPLLEHLSLSVDIDAYIDTDIPTRIDALWELSDKLREAKNTVFEGIVTDEARKLFS